MEPGRGGPRPSHLPIPTSANSASDINDIMLARHLYYRNRNKFKRKVESLFVLSLRTIFLNSNNPSGALDIITEECDITRFRLVKMINGI